MNSELFYYGLLHLGLSVLLSVFVLYFTFSRVTGYFRKKYNFGHDNIAYAIFIAGLIFSVLMTLLPLALFVFSDISCLNNPAPCIRKEFSD